MKRALLLGAAACVAALPISARAQTREVTGRVREAATGVPIPNAEVTIAGQRAGTCTNERGEYRLLVPAGEGPLVVRASGFDPDVFRLAPSDTTADFSLARPGEPRRGEAARGRFPSSDPRLLLVVEGRPVGALVTPDEPLYVVEGVAISSAPIGCRGG